MVLAWLRRLARRIRARKTPSWSWAHEYGTGEEICVDYGDPYDSERQYWRHLGIDNDEEGSR